MAAKEFQISVTKQMFTRLSIIIEALRGDPKFECQIQDEQVMW